MNVYYCKYLSLYEPTEEQKHLYIFNESRGHIFQGHSDHHTSLWVNGCISTVYKHKIWLCLCLL